LGFIAKIKQILNKKLKIDPGGGDLSTADIYVPVGDDSKPLITDFAVAMEIQRTGGKVVIGFYDPKNPSISSGGDKRIYSRDANTGSEKAYLWLKNTGEIILKNDLAEFRLSTNGAIKGSNSAGAFELLQNGDFITNGVKMTAGGAIEATSININGIPFSTHVHGGVTTGTATTGVPE
jgi:hypothetical protein